MKLWRRHPILTTAFVLALALTLGFAGRFVAQVVYWSNPAHQNQQVQAWMTVGYIARSWQVEGPDLGLEAGLPPPDGGPRTLTRIAADRGVPVAQIIAQVETAIARLQAQDAMNRAIGND